MYHYLKDVAIEEYGNVFQKLIYRFKTGMKAKVSTLKDMESYNKNSIYCLGTTM